MFISHKNLMLLRTSAQMFTSHKELTLLRKCDSWIVHPLSFFYSVLLCFHCPLPYFYYFTMCNRLLSLGYIIVHQIEVFILMCWRPCFAGLVFDLCVTNVWECKTSVLFYLYILWIVWTTCYMQIVHFIFIIMLYACSNNYYFTLIVNIWDG